MLTKRLHVLCRLYGWMSRDFWERQNCSPLRMPIAYVTLLKTNSGKGCEVSSWSKKETMCKRANKARAAEKGDKLCMIVLFVSIIADRRCRKADSRCRAGEASIDRRRCKPSLDAVRGTAPSKSRTPRSPPLQRRHNDIPWQKRTGSAVAGKRRDADADADFLFCIV